MQPGTRTQPDYGSLTEIALKKACLIPRAELDFEEEDLSGFLGCQAYWFHSSQIEPRLDIFDGIRKRSSSRRFHVDRIRAEHGRDPLNSFEGVRAFLVA
jgi:hypothetical protein